MSMNEDEDARDLNEENALEYKINRVQPSEKISKPRLLPVFCGDTTSGILIDSDASRSYNMQSVHRRMEED
jgi:hypothetical protein